MRYWDGAAWTSHFATEPELPAVDPGPGTSSDTPAPAGLGVWTAPLTVTGPPEPEPVKPHGRPVGPWSEALRYQQVVGESFHEEAFKAIAASYGHTSIPAYGLEITDSRAALIRDPENRYDSDAVAVWIDSNHLVGHLPRDAAAAYARRLESLDRGTYLQVPARVWIAERHEWDEGSSSDVTGIRGSVSLQVPEVEGVVSFNDLPEEPHVVLPWGRPVQITGEEHHMDALRTFVLGSVPRHVASTLHLVDEPRRSGGTTRVVEVRLDGERVGVMSRAMSDQIGDLVKFVVAQGRVPVARAIIQGSDLRADVTVHVARTSEVPQRWLDSVTNR
jgi:hypothetical protein